jgi:hypothetical protein
MVLATPSGLGGANTTRPSQILHLTPVQQLMPSSEHRPAVPRFSRPYGYADSIVCSAPQTRVSAAPLPPTL